MKFDEIKKNLDLNVKYTSYIKIRYCDNQWYMAGNQFGFSFSDDNDISELRFIIMNRIGDH